jgi:phosphatidylserine/phosphatidylglycerophosphate/cardiolipin synthase-like enzyme/DNA/RNA endonuclease YhcR with UshA esterase domain
MLNRPFHKFVIHLLIPFFLLTAMSAEAQTSISDARDLPLGSTVTITGVATNGDELGVIRFLQDSTGAIAVYPGTGSQNGFANNVSTGCLVQVTGVLKNFHNLLEIDPVTSYTVLSLDEPLPTPLAISPYGVYEANEALLVRVENIVFDDGGDEFAAGLYTYQNGSETGQLYLNSGSPLIGLPIPTNSVHITGIASQYDNEYQLLPRTATDITIADAFYFTLLPIQSNINTNSFTISWQTNIPGTSGLYYGTTPNMPEISVTGGSTSEHQITLDDLSPATIYYLQAFSTAAGETIESPVLIAATASQSSGEIRVYFNHAVDPDYSNGSTPDGTTGALALNAVLNKIEDAEYTIDMCAYNINADEIVDALNDAVNRGVRVRFITDMDSGNEALNGNENFPVLAGNPDGIMHNKTLVIDVEDKDACWVITGSMNFTEGNIFDDYNNLLMIQDQTLARTYTIEFEEIWGGDGDDFDIDNAKFGAEKSNNTPHLFNIGGRMMESYFSPSDPVTNTIVRVMETADASILFGLLTFTHDEIGDVIIERHAAGIAVKGIIDNTGDVGSEYNRLVFNDIPVVSFEPASGWQQFHHKYGIIDAEIPGSDPTVITGSHNWTAAAQNINDENTLVIYDEDIANLYRQEFYQRWCEFTDCTMATLDFDAGQEICLVYPNPADDFCVIRFMNNLPGVDIAGIVNSQGQYIRNIDFQQQRDIILINTSTVPAGHYRLLLYSRNQLLSLPFLVFH